MKRKLVITADDAGYDPGTNAAIVDLARAGRITATTVLAVAPDAGTFAGLVSAAGLDLALGVHVALNSEAGMAPWRPLSGGTTLATADGSLPVDPVAVEATASEDDVATEIDVQINAITSMGLHPVRLDSHCGTLYGLAGRPFIAQALDACATYKLGLRLPRHLESFTGPNPPAPLRAMHATAVQAADQMGVRLPQGMFTNPHSAQHIGGYEQLRAFYIGLLDLLPEGTSELFLHPSPGTPELMAASDQWIKRTWELRLLTDPLWLDALATQQIHLVPTW